MDQGFLTLSWDVPEAKLEEARGPLGPWQTVIATNSPYQVRPSTNLASRCGFYRLKMPAPGKKWLTVAAVTMTSQTNTAGQSSDVLSPTWSRPPAIAWIWSSSRKWRSRGVPGGGRTNVAPSARKWPTSEQPPKRSRAQSTSNVVAKAKELNLFVVFGMTEKDQAGLLYNANVFLGPDGVIGKHRKTFLVGNDGLIWSRGSGYEVLDSPLGKIGLMICAEMWSGGNFPGPVLAGQGADLLVTSSAWWNSVACGVGPSDGDQCRPSQALARRQSASGHDRTRPVLRPQPRGRSPGSNCLRLPGRAEGMVIWATDRVTDIRNP